MTIQRLFIMVAIFSALAFAPVTTYAANATFFGPIIDPNCECVGTAPDWGCVLQTVQNTVNLGISLGVMFAVLIIAYAGFLFMTSSVTAHNREKARTVLLHAVIGLVIALSAWLIVDFVMKALYNEDSQFGPWNSILSGGNRCLDVTSVPTSPTGTTNSGGVTAVGSHTASCPTCVSLSERGLTCKSANSCSAVPSVANSLSSIRFSGTWRVTEAFPPPVRHSASCQYDGTCVDAGFTGSTSYTVTNVKAFSDAVAAAGMCVVFETDNPSLASQARTQGVVSHSSSEGAYQHITGNHFSVYSNPSNCH